MLSEADAPRVTLMRPHRILLGFNGTDEARDALHLAGALARLEDDCEVIAVTAYELVFLPITVMDPEPDLLAETESHAEEVSQTLRGVRVRPEIVAASSPARGLHDAAEKLNADVVVVGSSHRGPLGRVLVGDVGERLLHGAPCAVAVAPRGFRERDHFGFGLVGVGYDGTDEAVRAVRAAREIAASLGAKLRVVGVCPERKRGAGEARHDAMREAFAAKVHEAARALVDEGADAEAVVLDGDPAERLSDQGVELDLLVVGSRGYGPIRRTLAGGVSGEVMRSSPCPVLIVPRGSGREPELGFQPPTAVFEKTGP